MIIDMISCWYCKMYETLAVYSYILNNINMISCQLSLEEILVDKQLGWLCNVYFWRYKLKYLYGLGRLSWFIKRLLLATRVRSPTTWLDLTAVNLLRRYDCIILIFRDFRIASSHHHDDAEEEAVSSRSVSDYVTTGSDTAAVESRTKTRYRP